MVGEEKKDKDGIFVKAITKLVDKKIYSFNEHLKIRLEQICWTVFINILLISAALLFISKALCANPKCASLNRLPPKLLVSIISDHAQRRPYERT